MQLHADVLSTQAARIQYVGKAGQKSRAFTVGERKRRLMRTINEDEFVEVLVDLQVAPNGTLTVGRRYSGLSAIAVLVRSE